MSGHFLRPSALLLLSIFASNLLAQQPPHAPPRVASQKSMTRDQINSQLDANNRHTEQLLRLLEEIAEDDQTSTRALEEQLDAIDMHNDILHEGLEKLDREDYVKDRRLDLTNQIQSLRSHAQQLERQGRNPEAAALQAKAAALQASLDAGTWLLRIGQEWNCDLPLSQPAEGAAAATIAELQQLRTEIQAVRNETSQLREEVHQMRRMLEQVLGEVKRLTSPETAPAP